QSWFLDAGRQFRVALEGEVSSVSYKCDAWREPESSLFAMRGPRLTSRRGRCALLTAIVVQVCTDSMHMSNNRDKEWIKQTISFHFYNENSYRAKEAKSKSSPHGSY